MTETQVADQARQKAEQVAGDAKEKAQETAGQAKDGVRTEVDQRSTQAGQQVRTTGEDLRSVAQSLRQQGKDQPARVAEQAAERADRLGGYLEESDADRILADIEDFARRRPMAVALGGLALGFAASRFLRASSTERRGSTPDAIDAQRRLPAPVPTPAPPAETWSDELGAQPAPPTTAVGV